MKLRKEEVARLNFIKIMEQSEQDQVLKYCRDIPTVAKFVIEDADLASLYLYENAHQKSNAVGTIQQTTQHSAKTSIRR